jgi:hypothetical protein
VADDQDRVTAPAPAGDKERAVPGQNLGALTAKGGSDSTLTVLVALTANLLIAVAKSIAAVVTRSASATYGR